LGVGLTSDGEYMDIQLNSVTTSEDMKQRLNQVMSEEMQVLEIRILPEESKTAMSMLAAADYRISRKDGYSTDIDSLEKEFALFLQQENISFVKKTKKGETTLDLKPFIYLCECKEDALFLQLSCGSVVNIKPEQVMEAFYGFLGKEYNPFAWQLHRIELYTDTNAPKGEINPHGSERTRCLVPLGSFGTLC
jgi:radical SAM-linked protein